MNPKKFLAGLLAGSLISTSLSPAAFAEGKGTPEVGAERIAAEQFDVAGLTASQQFDLAWQVNDILAPGTLPSELVARLAPLLSDAGDVGMRAAAARLVLGVAADHAAFAIPAKQLGKAKFARGSLPARRTSGRPRRRGEVSRRKARAAARLAAEGLRRLGRGYHWDDSARAELIRAAREAGLELPDSGRAEFDGTLGRGPAPAGSNEPPAAARPVQARLSRIKERALELADGVAHFPEGGVPVVLQTKIDDLTALLENQAAEAASPELEEVLRKALVKFLDAVLATADVRRARRGAAAGAAPLDAAQGERDVPPLHVRGLFFLYRQLAGARPDLVGAEIKEAALRFFDPRLVHADETPAFWTLQNLARLLHDLHRRQPERVGSEDLSAVSFRLREIEDRVVRDRRIPVIAAAAFFVVSQFAVFWLCRGRPINLELIIGYSVMLGCLLAPLYFFTKNHFQPVKIWRSKLKKAAGFLYFSQLFPWAERLLGNLDRLRRLIGQEEPKVRAAWSALEEDVREAIVTGLLPPAAVDMILRNPPFSEQEMRALREALRLLEGPVAHLARDILLDVTKQEAMEFGMPDYEALGRKLRALKKGALRNGRRGA
ncbi:MAG: hypothetical protein HY552_02110 [Elusimicrobia bacterium]|nr:hypothetical protein [Elusimicrobiota bacterium]